MRQLSRCGLPMLMLGPPMPPTPTPVQDFATFHATLHARVMAFLHRFVTEAEAEDLAQDRIRSAAYRQGRPIALRRV